MPITRRPWTANDVAKLRELAGKRTAKEIGEDMGRTEGAVAVEASKLKISLSTSRRPGRPPTYSQRGAGRGFLRTRMGRRFTSGARRIFWAMGR
jgi:hypothetical protein